MPGVFFLLSGLFLIITVNSTGQNINVAEANKPYKNNLVANGASLKMISDQFSFTEGPAVDKYGNVFFTDQPNNKIWKYATDGKLSLFLDSAGRSNGMYFDNNGNLISCADEHNELWSISPAGKVKVLLNVYEGRHFNGPNDCWVNKNGDTYFTDPYYQRDYWTRKMPDMDSEQVYLLRKNKVTVVADSFVRPNGIIGTADGKYLYVADIGAGKTYRYEMKKDGTLSNKVLFANRGSDGLTIDHRGNLYLTGKGITIFDPAGNEIQHIDVPGNWTANVTFGGKKKEELFITASRAVFVLKMKVHGQ